ncbi:single-stranded DNA-binding protein [Actinomadura kijaniata]|uniref:single-stranded DNA-binding protein n=1 Tax=Actinomadura kijaniata TaxID=46161 RepID=UPI00082F6365|nr:single-stranded DNA-binding protein [Actinomadura kijaniata]
MAGETEITLIGNLVEEPVLRFTNSGKAVCSLRLASTPRVFDRQADTWRDGETLFLTCTVWQQAAEHLCESALPQGARVIVHGRLKQRSYETKAGEKRTVYEVDVNEVGPSLRYATAKVTKAQRTKVNGFESAADSGTAPAAVPGWGSDGGATADPWNTASRSDLPVPF